MTSKTTINGDATPVNRQAAIFLSRKSRISTMEEALELFVDKLLSGGLPNQLREVCKSKDRPMVVIQMTLRTDVRTPGKYQARLSCFAQLSDEDEHYLALD